VVKLDAIMKKTVMGEMMKDGLYLSYIDEDITFLNAAGFHRARYGKNIALPRLS